MVKDSDNREIVKGAGTTFVLKIIGLVSSYGFNIYFARVYGAEVMGIFALAITVAGIFSLFAQMGTQTSLVRFVAQYAGQGNYNAVKKIHKMTLQWVLPLSIYFAVLFYFLSPFIANRIFYKPLLIVTFKITAFVLPFGVLMGVNTASLRGLQKIKDAFVFSTVLPPVFNHIGLNAFNLRYFYKLCNTNLFEFNNSFYLGSLQIVNLRQHYYIWFFKRPDEYLVIFKIIKQC